MEEQPSLNPFARQLINLGLISQEAALSAIQAAQQTQQPFVKQLVDSMVVDQRELAMVSAVEFGLPLLDLDAFDPEMIPKNLLDEKFILRTHVLPLLTRGQKLFVALSDPTNFESLEDLKFKTGLKIEAVLVEEHKLSSLIAGVLGTEEKSLLSDPMNTELESLEIQGEEKDLSKETKEDSNDDAPIVRFINKILVSAIQSGASDIHFEPYEKSYRIRFRQDGVLREVAAPPVHIAARLASRIKIMSRLDIAEKRLPQDGRFKIHLSKNKSVDFRVSTCPTLFGEKIVSRILDPSATSVGIDALGYEEPQKKLFLQAINRPDGMVLVTGPTGSGKTVSLYTALNILNTKETNISTAEDPVEINIAGLNQVQMNTKIGLTFATALRSFLRQDPDVMMVGEIRDLETAEIAVKAAQTGHLVLSTLHTNSAAETIMRLLNMGIPAYNVATSINLIIAQRLVRRLCSHCKVGEILPRTALVPFGYPVDTLDRDPEIFQPKGCAHCSNGYKGRIGIYETLAFTQNIASQVLSQANSIELQKEAIKEGMETLYISGLRKVLSGTTSMQELSRIVK